MLRVRSLKLLDIGQIGRKLIVIYSMKGKQKGCMCVIYLMPHKKPTLSMYANIGEAESRLEIRRRGEY